jgi:hypothetical protein
MTKFSLASFTCNLHCLPFIFFFAPLHKNGCSDGSQHVDVIVLTVVPVGLLGKYQRSGGT